MTVEVILLERMKNLGDLGDVVRVAPGYARNFLLPNGKALRANAENKKKFESERKKFESAHEAKKLSAEKTAKKVDGTKIKLVRAASETGQLYGSVNARDIAEALDKKGHKVERSYILIGKPIKDIGNYQIAMRFHADISADIMVEVVKNAEDVITIEAPSSEDRKLDKAKIAEQIKIEKKISADRAKLAKQTAKMVEQPSTEKKFAKKPSTTKAPEKKLIKKPATTKAAVKKSATKKSTAKKKK
ncbi:MAG: 50S ribosomal protein L9 [Alphaproteobacteria bacterium]